MKNIFFKNNLDRNFKYVLILSIFLSFSQTAQSQMNEAYKMANDMVRSRLSNEDKENITILDNLEKNDVIVVGGTYDHIHRVLQSLEIPFVSIDHNQLLSVKLYPHQTIFVNCSSSFPAEAARKLATFVKEGGQLITTDWALKNVLEVAFPNTVAYNNKPTDDEVVRIETIDHEDEVIKGFLDEQTDPVWWLEGSSYPIKILDKEKVKVLIRSKELKEKYGEEAIVVRFTHGEGTVYHMISHFYLQRTETRDQKQQLNASLYGKDKGASDEEVLLMSKSKVSYGEIQSANTSADFVTRMIIKQARNKKK
jgi:hypothetical protein